MNNVYNLVWNGDLRQFVVASELAKGKVKGRNGSGRSKRRAVVSAAASGVVVLTASMLSGPVDAFIASGSTGTTLSADGGQASNTSINGGSVSSLATNAMAIGPSSSAVGSYSTAIGAGSSAVGTNSTAIGGNASVSGNYGTAIGYQATVSNAGVNAIAIGYGAKAFQSGAIAIGDSASASGSSGAGIAIGRGATTGPITPTVGMSETVGIAIGSGAQSTWGVAIGEQAKTTNNQNGVSIGRKTTSGLRAVAIGSGSIAGGEGSIAMGEILRGTVSGAAAGGTSAVALNGNAGGQRSVAIGSAAYTGTSDGAAVALGADSLTAQAIGTTGVTIAGNRYTFAGTAPGSTVSVGDVGKERTITNVAAGRLGGTSTDAINGSQLYSTNVAIETLDKQTVKYDKDAGGTVNYNNITLAGTTYNSTTKTGGTRITNVAPGVDGGDAVNIDQLNDMGDDLIAKGMNFAGNSGANVHRDLGETLAITGAASTAGTYSGGNLKTVTDPATGAIQLQMADAPKFGGVTVNDGNSGKITGVADGVDDNDAVNISQLHDATADAVMYDDSTHNNITLGGTTYNSTTKTGGTRIKNVAAGVDGGDAVNVDQLNDMGGDLIAKGMDFAGNSGTTVHRDLGDTLAITGKATTAGSYSGGNLKTVTDPSTGAIQLQMADAPKFGGVTINDGNSGKITGLSDGVDDNDAVNISQLHDATVDAVMYDDSTHGSVTLGGSTYNSTTKTGGTRIKNVAAGVDGGDAVNVDQLTDTVAASKTHYYSVNDNGVTSGNYANDGATGVNALAAGVNAKATVDGGVALGSDALASTAAGVAGFVPSTSSATDKTAIAATTSTRGAVAVGDAAKGIYRQITGVAAGAADSDAVNVSQLKGAVAGSIADAVMYDDSTHGSVTLGGTTYNSTTKTGGTRIKNVAAGVDGGDAVNVDQLNDMGGDITSKGMDFAGNSGAAVHRDLGETLTITGAATTAGTYSGDNLKTVTDPATGAIQLQIADAPKFGGVTINDSNTGKITGLADGVDDSDAVNVSQLHDATADAVMYDDSTHTSVTMGGPTSTDGGVTGGTKITNVAQGELSATSTDAVNGAQLFETNTNVTNIGDTITNIAGDTSTSYTDIHGVGIRYVRTNEAGLTKSDSSAEGQGSTAVGYNATAKGDSSLALGRESKATTDGGVALGSDAVASTVAGVAGFVPSTSSATDKAAIAATSSTRGAISVGDASNGIFRQINGVAAGSEDSDAVNVSQLKGAVAGSIADAVMYDDSTHNNITLGGATYNSTTKTGGTRIKNVAAGVDGGDAVNVDQLNDMGGDLIAKGMDFAGNSGATVHRDLGDTLAITGAATTAGTYSGGNLKTVTDPATGAIQLQIADSPKFGGVTINDSNSGKITGLADGVDDNDAVNVSQLHDATADAVMYDDSTHGSVTMGGTTYNGTTKTGGTRIKNVAAGVDGGDAVNVDQLTDTVAASKTHYYSVNDNGTVGSNYDNDGATGVNALAAGVNAKASADGGVALGSDAVASTVAGVAGFVPSTSSATDKAAIAATTSTRGAVAVGDAANGVYRQITGVAAGAQDSDAVNVSQLRGAVAGSIADAVMYDDSTHNSVTLGGTTYDSTTRTGGTRIKNVAAGVDGGDAVNVDQLNDMGGDLTSKGMDFAGNSGATVHRDLGETLAITGEATTAGTYSGGNLKTVTDPATGAIQLQIADAPKFGGVTINDGDSGKITGLADGVDDNDAVNMSQLHGATADAVMYDDSTHTSVTMGGPISTDGGVTGGTKITNVTQGELSDTSTDAVNGSQLFETNTNITNLGDTINNIAGDTSTSYTDIHGVGIRYVRTNEAGLAKSDSSAEGQGSTAVGYNATATGDSSLALGRESKATTDGSVALGSDAVASTAAGVAGYVPNGTGAATSAAIAATTSTRGAVSVGDAGNGVFRQITGVAAGLEDSDAVNVSQLKGAVAGSVADAVMYDDSTHNNITLGGTTYNSTTKTGGTRITNVAAGVDGSDAVNVDQLNDMGGDITSKGMDFAGNSGGTVHRDLGETLTITGEATTAGTYSGGNFKTATDPATGAIQLQIADAPKFGGVTINDGDSGKITGLADGVDDNDAVNMSQLHGATADAVMYDDSTHTSVTMGGPISTDGGVTGGTKITNVAQGELSDTSTDAVNGSQLFETNTNVTNLGDTINNIAGDTSTSYTDIHGVGIRYVRTNEAGLAKSDSSAEGQGSTAVGYNAKATGDSSLAMGRDSQATIDGGVALGSDAVASTAAGVAGYVPSGTGAAASAAINATTGTRGAVSVGDAGNGIFRQITGVAAGSEDSDAVNVSQLKGAVAASVADAVMYDDSTHDSVTLGGSTYDSTTRTGGTRIKNVAAGVDGGDAVNVDQLNDMGGDITSKGMDFAGNSGGTVHRDLGETLTITGEATTAGTYSGGNLKTVTDPATGAIQLQIADAPKFGGVTINDGGSGKITGLTGGTDATDAVNVSQLTSATADAVMYDDSTHTSVTMGGPTSTDGGVTGGTKITNVAQGELSATSTDAVNGAQLFETNTNITNLGNTINNIAGDTSTSYTDIHGVGIRYVRTNEAGLAKSDSSAEGQGSTAVGYNATATGDSSLALGRESKATVDGGVALGSDAVASTMAGVAGYVPGSSASAAAAIAATISTRGAVSVGDAGNGIFRQITGVAAGSEDSDAVNVSQLKAVAQETADLSDRAVQYDLNPDGSVNYGNVTMGGSRYDSVTRTGGTRITNVARGVDDSDAVNMSQLDETNAAVTEVTETVNNFAGDQSTTNTEYNGRGIRYVRTNDTGLGLSDAFAQGQGSTAVGYNALSTGESSLAMGRDAKASAADGVALGSQSVAGTAAGVAGWDAKAKGASTDDSATWKSTRGAVSVGDAANGVTRQINGVAAGSVDTDAVNVAQLKQVAQATSDLSDRALKYDLNADGSVNYGTATLEGSVSTDGGKTGGTKISNLSQGDVSEESTDAINGSQLFAIAGDTSDTYITRNGKGVRYVRTNDAGLPQSDAWAQGQGSSAVGYNATAKGDSSIALGRDAQANHAGDVALGQGSSTAATVATSGTTIAGDSYAFAGTTPTSTVSVGSEGKERTITNVAAGQISADSTDAVNGSQLYATNQAVDKIDGRVTNVENTLYDIAGDITNISTGQAGMFQTSADQKAPAPTPTGTNSAAGGANATASGNNSLAVGNSAQASAENSTAIGTSSRATASNSVAIGANSVADRADSVSVGSAGGERQIVNVAAGVQATDAVNVSQLKASDASSVKYDSNVDGSVNYNSVTLNQGGNGPTTIHNVQAGSATTDAVNVGQLNEAMSNTQNWAKNYTDNQVNQMGKRASAGTASAMAMAGIPQAYQPNQSSVGAAVGTYRGQSGIAVGLSTISESGRYIFKVSGTATTKGDAGMAVGAGMVW